MPPLKPATLAIRVTCDCNVTEEALAAKEAFITSATVFVQAVVTIDGKKVADGKPGAMTNRLREIYVDFAKATAT